MLGNEVLQLEDTGLDVFMKMSEGNPGAMTVLMQIFEKTQEIDPENTLGGLGVILCLDTMGLRGSRIWMLYKDVCGESMLELQILMRANQLGVISTDNILGLVRKSERTDCFQFVDGIAKVCPDLKIIEIAKAHTERGEE